MKIVDNNEINNFLKLSIDFNQKIGKNALRDVDEYLNKEFWLDDCDNVLEFYCTYYRMVYYSCYFLLFDSTSKLPDILCFLHANQKELEESFELFSIKNAEYHHIKIYLEYLMSTILVKALFNDESLYDDELVANEALKYLFNSDRYVNGSDEEREKMQAYGMLLGLCYKRYNDIISKFEQDYKYSLAEYESSSRSIIKECYMISKIATENYDSDLMFGANTSISILKYQYYLGRVNEDLDAKIELIPLLIMVHLHKVLVSGQPQNPMEIFSLMQPKKVLDELQEMQEK